MSDEITTTETQSDAPQQVDPNADLMKARPGGTTQVAGKNPGTGYRDEKTESTFEGPGSEGGYEDGPATADLPPA